MTNSNLDKTSCKPCVTETDVLISVNRNNISKKIEKSALKYTYLNNLPKKKQITKPK